MAHFEYSSIIPGPRKEVYNYVSDIDSLPEIMSSDYKIEATSPAGKIQKGGEYEIKITRMGISVAWGIVIEDFNEGEFMRDRQSHGPFSLWVHTQKFEDHGQGTLLTDLIEYDVPFGILGKLADDLFVRHDLKHIFKRRHDNIGRYFGTRTKET